MITESVCAFIHRNKASTGLINNVADLLSQALNVIKYFGVILKVFSKDIILAKNFQNDIS